MVLKLSSLPAAQNLALLFMAWMVAHVGFYRHVANLVLI